MPVEPFQGDARMIGVQAPAVEWFVGDRVSFHAVLTEIPVASRGNGAEGTSSSLECTVAKRAAAPRRR